MAIRNQTSPAKLQLQLEVIGSDVLGQQFFEPSATQTVHRNGVSCVLSAELAPGIEVIVRNPKTDVEAVAYVVGQTVAANPDDGRFLTFLETSPALWKVQFPAAGTSRTVGLECMACHATASEPVSDIELELFEAAKAIARHCQKCNSISIWRETSHPSKTVAPARSAVTPVATPAPPPQAEHRRNRRASMKAHACIRFSGSEIVVACEDISKGGFRFLSSKEYHEGLRVDAAAPYTKSSNNIFCPATIVYCHKTVDGQFRHGVSYIVRRGPTGWDP